MTLSDLTRMAAAQSGRSHAICHAVAQEFLHMIVTAATKGKPVILKGSMTFYTKTRKPRPARNPRNGDVVMLPVRRVMLCRWPGRRIP